MSKNKDERIGIPAINDLKCHTRRLAPSIEHAVARVIASGWFVLGPEVEAFERSFAAYVRVNHCRTVANGTDALELALRAVGVNRNSIVATVANAGFYTSNALLAIGANPLYLDVDGDTCLVTLDEVERAIRTGVKAVVVTHLYGQAVLEIAQIAMCCRAAGVALVEDCAQAHGAKVGSKQVGSFGDIGCFSFYPTKNLGALGDGGAVVCNSAALASEIAHLRQYGWSAKYQVDLAGARNSRLDEIQAAVLSEFLPYLDSWNERRRDIASQYSLNITHPSVKLPLVGGGDYVAHLYVIRCSERDRLREYLQRLDIATDIHYPIPDYRQPIFVKRFSELLLPNTEQLAQECLTLPCYPEMVQADVERVVSAINHFSVTALEQNHNF